MDNIEAVELLTRAAMEFSKRCEDALEMAFRYGGNDGAHHKDWVIDQMVRILASEEYEAMVKEANHGEDGPETYEWEVGIPP